MKQIVIAILLLQMVFLLASVESFQPSSGSNLSPNFAAERTTHGNQALQQSPFVVHVAAKQETNLSQTLATSTPNLQSAKQETNSSLPVATSTPNLQSNQPGTASDPTSESALSVPLATLPDSLQQAINQAERSPNADLFYNIGVDFFALGDVGRSNLYYLKALNINSAHKYARANLDTSIRLGQDAKLYPQHLFLVRVFFQVMDSFSVQLLAVLSLLFLIFSALTLIWLINYNPAKEQALPILVFSLFLLLCICFFTALGIKSYRQTHNPTAVVIVPQTALYPANGNSQTAVQELHSGLIVRLVAEGNKQHLVRLPDGQLGKVNAKHVLRVNPK